MSNELKTLLEKARLVTITPTEQEAQRRSFAYGNTHFENSLITRDMIDRAAAEMKSAHGQKD